jgi:hypothetical protein
MNSAEREHVLLLQTFPVACLSGSARLDRGERRRVSLDVDLVAVYLRRTFARLSDSVGCNVVASFVLRTEI